jgi:hypothetical protein
VDSTSSALSCGATNSTGTTPPEQLIAVRPDLSSGPILAGEQALFQSVQTGKFCRVVQQAGQSRLVCDVDSAGQATPLDYTGSGVC